MKLKSWITNENITTGAWLIACGATIGSLVLSEVMALTPCALCWYQRICMFPLMFILGTAVKRRDSSVPYYVLPISLLGMLIAAYHTLLQWGVIKEAIQTCSIDSSCATPQINWLGFITIPFMSFIAFAAINGLMFYSLRMPRKE